MWNNAHYLNHKVDGFSERWVHPDQLHRYLISTYGDKAQKVGQSYGGFPLFQIRMGQGSKKVVVWSQMHGNENTGTRAMLDVMNLLTHDSKYQQVLQSLELVFLPMINPDASLIHNRRTPQGIDMNRDFNAESTPEMQWLKALVKKENPVALFNMHDQRTLFNVAGTDFPATLSFLAPSEDKERNVTLGRQKTMGIIAHIYNSFDASIQNYIGLYSDEFYPNATGDNFQKWGYPTVLFEGGHYPNDWKRETTRQYYAQAIYNGLDFIAKQDDLSQGHRAYFRIPQMEQRYFDWMVKSINRGQNDAPLWVDLGFRYREVLHHETFKLELHLEEIGDLSGALAHHSINAKQVPLDWNLIKIGDRINDLMPYL